MSSNLVGAAGRLCHEHIMNNHRDPRATSPQHALLAPQQPMHREPPPLWTSCLTSKPLWSGEPTDLLRRRDDRTPPLFPVMAAMLGTWDPGRHPVMRMRRQQPTHREAAGSPPPAPVARPDGKGADAAALPGIGVPAEPIAPPQNPIRREAPPIGPLRNGNPRGNPNLAPRCGAKTRTGCPCKGPAMKNGRCRMHGGASTGPRTPEGRARIAAARTTSSPAFRALQAQTAVLTARNRVLTAVVKTGLPMEALTPLIHRIKPEARNSPYAASPLLLLGTDLSPAEARDLIQLIHASVIQGGNSPCAVRAGGPKNTSSPAPVPWVPI